TVLRKSGFSILSLDRSQSKKDGGFKNNWSFDHAEESEGDYNCLFTNKYFFCNLLIRNII
uniref:Uncharacterized protein n=1 Tax=Pavo cristatus TaxID=9049 RepID=A0A8C9EZS4_PAVCR